MRITIINLDVKVKVEHNQTTVMAIVPIAVKMPKDEFMESVMKELNGPMPHVNQNEIEIVYVAAKDIRESFERDD